jgi:hypothetical protein
MPLVVLADLVARHVTPEVATSSVAALVERGAPDQELARLRSRVETEIGRGQSPDLATRTRTAAVLEELPRSSTPRRPLRPPASSTGP